MKLIIEENFDLDNLVELNESSGEKIYVLKGTFSTPDVKNRNGRIYSKSLWEENVERYQKEIQNKTVNTLCEKEHPPRTSVDPWSAVAQIRKLEMRNGVVYGEAELLNIPETLVMRSLIDRGIKIGVSSRGTGVMKGDIVEKFNLVTYDIVSAPSDYNANLQGFNESMILEGYDFIESNKKGQYICTPEGCNILSEGQILEAKNVKCPSCGSSKVSYINEAGTLKLKCEKCKEMKKMKDIEQPIGESLDEAFNLENAIIKGAEDTLKIIKKSVKAKDKKETIKQADYMIEYMEDLKKAKVLDEARKVAIVIPGGNIIAVLKNEKEAKDFIAKNKIKNAKIEAIGDFMPESIDESKRENEQSVIYDTRTKKQVGTKVYANSRNAHKAMDKMDDKEYLKVASKLFFVDNIKESESTCECNKKADKMIEIFNAFASRGIVTESEKVEAELLEKAKKFGLLEGKSNASSTWHVISNEGITLAVLSNEKDAEDFRKYSANGYYKDTKIKEVKDNYAHWKQFIKQVPKDKTGLWL